MIGNIYNADVIREQRTDTMLPNGKWVAARPINYQHMAWFERLAVAWQVFRGKYDALEWSGQ